MQTRNFSFNVPQELIAQKPAETRGACRLMTLERHSGRITHHAFTEIPDLLPEGAVVVFNDSKVRRARLLAETGDGGKVECLLIDEMPDLRYRAILSRRKRRRLGETLHFPDGVRGTIVGVEDPYRILSFDTPPDWNYLENHGHVPLPPYINRSDNQEDSNRYQTVYARSVGSAAAPTAGLHFTRGLIDSIRDAGHEIAFVTLHVGIGTFLPIRTASVEEHSMHSESYTVPEESARKINRAIDEARPVVAVGTTSVRTLESAWLDGGIRTGSGKTSLFITPGYVFSAVNSIVTNFHTPESSLIVMISAFAGMDLVKTAYARAIEEEYRFFSYGDAMLIV